jgi:thymidylate synthase
MKQYIETGKKILEEGIFYGDRTKVGRLSIFGVQQRYNLADGFPLVTTKKTYFEGVVKELLWFLTGSMNADKLSDQGVKIWDGWKVTQEHLDNPSDRVKHASGYNAINLNDPGSISTSDYFGLQGITLGHIGPMYGAVMRNAEHNDGALAEAIHGAKCVDVGIAELASDKLRLAVSLHLDKPEEQREAAIAMNYDIDQMQQLVLNLKRNPHSSRHMVSHWIPEYLPDERLSPQENVLLGKQALAPCHVLQQYYCIDLTHEERYRLAIKKGYISNKVEPGVEFQTFCTEEELDTWGIPKYKLSLQMYQR